MDYIKFQEDAIQDLVSQFKDLWQQDEYKLPITLKAPTGSGKTYITEKFICSMANQPDWDQPIAYIWITFSDDLAMQSRNKFEEYFFPNCSNQLLTVQDFKNGVLKNNISSAGVCTLHSQIEGYSFCSYRRTKSKMERMLTAIMMPQI